MTSQRERRERTVRAIVSAALALAASRTFAEMTVADIVGAAGVAKGAFYHHFPSKDALLELLVDRIQADIAAELRSHPQPSPLTPLGLAAALEQYLLRAARPDRRQILLRDGPALLGWERWRQIDDRHFAGMTRAGLEQIMPATATARELDLATQLVLGAVMEAALHLGDASDPSSAAAEYRGLLQYMLTGVSQSP